MTRINKLVIIPLILVLVLVLSMSYALFTKEVSTNSRIITLKSGNKYIGIYGSDKENIEFDHEYTFTVENRGNQKARYQLMIESITELDLSKINYTVTRGTDVKTGILSDTVLYKKNLEIGSSDEIKVTLTLDSTYKQSLINNNISLNYKGLIKINTVDYCEYNAGDIVFNKTYTTASPYTFEVPCDGNYKVELWGAQGGNAKYATQYYGGKAGYTAGNLELKKDNNLYVYCGGMGVSHSGTTSDSKTINGNGYNGGNQGVFYSENSNGGGGGGATDIRYFGIGYTPTADDLAWNSALGLKSRIMVAAGGGGADSHRNSPSWSGNGGAAGGLNGYDCDKKGSCYSYGVGATQISAGRTQSCGSGYSTYYDSGFGFGGQTLHSGGGSGYYGGGSGHHTSAAGGSSFISGHTGCNAINLSGTHTGQPNHYSGLVFTNTKMIDGNGYKWTNVKGSLEQMPNPSGGYYASGVGHSGNGYARITYLGD